MELVIATAGGGVLLRVNLAGRRKLTLGRSRKCDVRLSGAGISRHHALLVEEAGRWMIIDLSATHGLWLNGSAVRTAMVSTESPIRIGDLFLWFYGESEAALPPPRVQPWPAPVVALRAEYIEALWRSRALAPVPAIRAVA